MRACRWLACAAPLWAARTLLAAGAPLPELIVQGGTSKSFLYTARASGPWAATAGSDQTIRIWEIESGHIARVLPGHDSPVEAVAFSADHKRLASVAESSEVAVWDLFSGASLFARRLQTPRPGAVAFNHDGSLLFIGDSEGGVSVLDTAARSSSGRRPTHEGAINALERSGDGRLLAAAGGDGRVSLWNAQTGDLVRFLDPPPDLRAPQIPFAGERPDAVASVALNRDGTQVAAGRMDGTVIVWSAGGGVITASRGHGAGAMAVAFSADEQDILVAHEDFTLARRSAGDLRRVRRAALPHQTSPSMLTLTGRWPVSFSDDASRLIFGSHISTLTLFGIASGEAEQVLKEVTVETRSIAFDPTGATLLLGLDSGKVAWWDGQSGERGRITTALDKEVLALPVAPEKAVLALPAAPEKAVLALGFSPDGTWFATGGRTPGIRIWDAATGEQLRTIAPRIRAQKFALGPRGSWLATDGGGAVLLWDTANGGLLRSLSLGPAGWSAINDFAVSPDGRKIAAASNTTVKLWEMPSGRELPLPRLAGALAVTFASGGRDLVTATVAKASGLMIVHLSDGSVEGPFPAHSRLINSLKANPDGKQVLSAGDDGKIRVWTVGDWGRPRVLEGHGGELNSAAFSPDGKLLLAAGSDGMTVIWDAGSGRRLLSLLELADGSGWLAVAPDGLFDGRADAMARVSWRYGAASDSYPLDYFYNDYFHPGLLAEVLHGARPKAEINVALRLPGLRAMAQEGLAHIETSGADSYLCLANSRPAAGQTQQGRGLRLFGRGGELALSRLDFSEYPNDSSCPHRIRLPSDGGPYELAAARPRRRTNSAAQPAGAPSSTARSTLHVFTVGIDKYADSGYHDLSFARADADAIDEFFARQGKSPSRPFAQVHPWPPLRDEQATLAAIRRELAEMAKTVAEEDVVVLFFAGHGTLPPGKEMFYFVSHGAIASVAADAPQEAGEEGLSTAMIAEAMRDLRARRIVVVIDSCQAGAAFDSLGKVAEMKRAIEELRGRAKRVPRAGPQSPVGVYLLAAASPLQEAQEAGHGLLTKALLRSLGEGVSRHRPQPRPREIRMRWLTASVAKEVLRLARRAHADQTALPLSIGADFAIATGAHGEAAAGNRPAIAGNAPPRRGGDRQ